MGEENINGVESLFYVAICSVLITFFIGPYYTIVFSELSQVSFLGKRLGMLVFLLCLTGVVHYLVRTNDHYVPEKELAKLPFSSVFQIDDPCPPWYPASDPPSYWPWSPESEPPPSSPAASDMSAYCPSCSTCDPWSHQPSSPAASDMSAYWPSCSTCDPWSHQPSSPAASDMSAYWPSCSTCDPWSHQPSSPAASYPYSSPVASYSSAVSYTSSSYPAASYPSSSSMASYRSSSSAVSYRSSPASTYPPLSPTASYPPSSSFSSFYSPPLPPFRVRPPTFIMRGDLARIVSDFSLSLSEDSRFEDSGDSDIDTKAGKFIKKNKNNRKIERRKTRMAKKV